MIELNKFESQIYTQSGEDGILIKLFDVLKIDIGWFCEFGAGDGNNISNTRNFRENGWSGVLIEGDEERFIKMKTSPLFNDTDNVYMLNNFISCESGEKIDELLSTTPIPEDFDLLSIDIDGNDLWVWKSMEKYRPKAIVIEYNANYSIEESLTIEYDKNHRFNHDAYYGASAAALIKLAKEKNYDLVAYTHGLNLFFVDQKYSHFFKIMDPQIISIHRGWPESKRKMVKY